MLTIHYEGKAVQTALAKTVRAMQNPRPLLQHIGNELAHSTMQRFKTSTAPDCSLWKANEDSTLDIYASRFGYKRRSQKRAGKKPLVGESGRLSGSITARVQGNAIVVGSDVEYAAVHQFGVAKGSLWQGKDRRNCCAKP